MDFNQPTVTSSECLWIIDREAAWLGDSGFKSLTGLWPRCWLGPPSPGSLTLAGGPTCNLTPLRGCWQEASVLPSLTSQKALECPRDMAQARKRRKPQCLFCLISSVLDPPFHHILCVRSHYIQPPGKERRIRVHLLKGEITKNSWAYFKTIPMSIGN